MGGPRAARDAGGMSRTARLALAAAAVLAGSGALSGLLIDEYGGVLGGLEWVARTLVVVSAAIALAAGLVLVLRLRHRVRSRLLGWALAAVAAAAFAFAVVQPVAFGVYLTHLPARRAVQDADLGAPKQPVRLTTASGLRLQGWYVPSRNGAAVALLHGTGSNRNGVADHARLLARHGYGVLLFDLHGHGDSDGRSTSIPARFQADADAALAFLRDREDVRAGRIGVVGVSLGGEIALDAAARRPGWRAVVLEGVQGGSPADLAASRPDPASAVALTALHGVGRLLGGPGPSGSNPELIERIAPRPLLLLSSGSSTEARANAAYDRRGGAATWHWNLPGAPHAAALRTDPAGYEAHVIGFLDRALRDAAPAARSR
jgi:pimeloyl-ACP methyl ester carboxylesterase